MTLVEIRTHAKIEAGLRDDDNLNGYIDAVINRKLREYTHRRKYPELFVDAQILATVTDDGTLALPINVQHFHGIQNPDGTTLLPYPRHRRSALLDSQTPARYYYRKGSSIEILPQVGTIIGDSYTIFYYKYPDPLVNDTDVLPIPELEATLIHATAATIASKGGDPSQYQVQKQEEGNSFVATR